MLCYYSYHGQVRDSDLDQFAVVNNSVYSRYLEHGRHLLLGAVGLHPAQSNQNNESWVLSKILIDFCASLTSGDEYRVDSGLAEIKKVRLVFTQQIYCFDKLIVKAWAEAALLNGAGKPIPLPITITKKLEQYRCTVPNPFSRHRVQGTS